MFFPRWTGKKKVSESSKQKQSLERSKVAILSVRRSTSTAAGNIGGQH